MRYISLNPFALTCAGAPTLKYGYVNTECQLPRK